MGDGVGHRQGTGLVTGQAGRPRAKGRAGHSEGAERPPVLKVLNWNLNRTLTVPAF